METFDKLDQEYDWPGGELIRTDYSNVPDWLMYTREQVESARQIAQKKVSVTGEGQSPKAKEFPMES